MQLVMNLLSNAIKYTPDGGRITIALTAYNKWARILISDTGVGIPEEDLPHVFDRFYRVDRARTRKQGGAGLGLAIANWIADAHGGRITIESQVDHGTTFTIWLPAPDLVDEPIEKREVKPYVVVSRGRQAPAPTVEEKVTG
jgi:signal transduction histidine kinase